MRTVLIRDGQPVEPGDPETVARYSCTVCRRYHFAGDRLYEDHLQHAKRGEVVFVPGAFYFRENGGRRG